VRWFCSIVQMKRLLPRVAACLAVLFTAFAAALAPIGPAGAAESSPARLLNLGTGKVLGWNGEVAPAPGGALYLWVRVSHPGFGALPGFTAPYQLRNPITNLCLLDYGDGHQVVSAPCLVDVTADSPQLWQHHRTPDRIAHEHPYGFVFNRVSGRVLTARPSTASPWILVVTVPPVDPHSAAAAFQLWTAIAP
jgi:hypothetical protein